MVLGRIATGRLSALAGCVIALALPACGDSQGGDDDGGGQGNEAGSGGSVPNDYVAQLDLMPPTRLDLLLMIDNSLSMSGKQRLLADSIPPLLSRLTSPVCRDAQDRIVGAPPCPPSALPEFRALEDIHIGVITSSLGHHGSNDLCSADEGATKDDRAQLLPSVRAGLSSWNNQGFLAWDPRSGVSDAHVPAAWGAPGGPGNAGSFADALADHVVGVGENGCGYEGSLEAWYRFLIDPEPAGELGNDGNGTLRNATNTLILEQRAAFICGMSCTNRNLPKW